MLNFLRRISLTQWIMIAMVIGVGVGWFFPEFSPVVFFTILFAVTLTQVKGKPKEIVLGFCEGLSEVMFKFTGVVMKFAPIGIGAAMAYTVGHSGLSLLINLGKLVLTLYGAHVSQRHWQLSGFGSDVALGR